MSTENEMKLSEFLAIDDSLELDQEFRDQNQVSQEIKLEEIGTLCERAEKQQQLVEQLTKELKEQTAILKDLLEEQIPETLEAAGLRELKLSSGKKITVVDDLAYNISEQRRANCMQWLRDRHFDSIIKNVVSVQFAKGEDSNAQKCYQKLLEQGFNATHKEDVHWQTMKAFLKEQVRQNTLSTSDKELFGIYEFKTTKIK